MDVFVTECPPSLPEPTAWYRHCKSSGLPEPTAWYRHCKISDCSRIAFFVSFKHQPSYRAAPEVTFVLLPCCQTLILMMSMASR